MDGSPVESVVVWIVTPAYNSIPMPWIAQQIASLVQANANSEPVAVRRLERPGFKPLPIGIIIPPNGTLDLPARDARGGTLVLPIIRCLDIVAPRKFATVRHAGELLERRGLIDEIHLDQLPLVPKILGRENGSSVSGQISGRGQQDANQNPAME